MNIRHSLMNGWKISNKSNACKQSPGSLLAGMKDGVNPFWKKISGGAAALQGRGSPGFGWTLIYSGHFKCPSESGYKL